MKTTATKTAEKYLGRYDPEFMSGIEINRKRPRHTMYEVPVIGVAGNNGIVDAVRIAEYWRNTHTENECLLSRIPGEDSEGVDDGCLMGIEEGMPAPSVCNAVGKCRWQRERTVGYQSMLVVCIEIKTSSADFYSLHGHNFVGHLNYYLLPEEIYEQVKADIPENIGVLTLYDGLISEAKKSAYFELNSNAKQQLLLSSMKAQDRYVNRRRHH